MNESLLYRPSKIEDWENLLESEQKQADDEEQSDEERSDNEEQSDEERSDDEEQSDEERSDNEEQSDEERSDNEEQSDEEPDNKQSDDEINFAEDDYESSISNLNSLVRYLNNATIREVWSVKTIEQNKEHFVVISDNANHLCTCMLLVSKGLVCRHFFSVMTNQCFTSDSFQIDGIMKRPLIIKKNLQLQFVGNAQQI